MLGGIGFAYRQGQESWGDYCSRIIDPKRIAVKWYVVILLFVPVLMAIAMLLDFASGRPPEPARIGETVTPLSFSPLTIVPYLFGIFWSGPFPEELGWRGYVLDRLQARWSALIASLILGVLWALWHLPLFFMKGTYHYRQGAWSAWFWLFMVGIIPTAIIFTWIFNNTRRSTLGAILFHFMANLTYELAGPTARTNFYATVLWIIAAVAVVASGGPGTLARRARVPSR